MLLTRTEPQPFCILRAPSDIVFIALFNCGYHPNDLRKKPTFYKWGHISGPKGSPDMILNAFHVKFHDKQKWDTFQGQKYSKINKFPKSPSSVGDIPRFRFLMYMAIIKDQKSTLEMATRPKKHNCINKNLHFWRQHGT